MAVDWRQARQVTTTRTTEGQRFALDDVAHGAKRDRSAQIAVYIEQGLRADGYAPDERGKWTRREEG